LVLLRLELRLMNFKYAGPVAPHTHKKRNIGGSENDVILFV